MTTESLTWDAKSIVENSDSSIPLILQVIDFKQIGNTESSYRKKLLLMDGSCKVYEGMVAKEGNSHGINDNSPLVSGLDTSLQKMSTIKAKRWMVHTVYRPADRKRHWLSRHAFLILIEYDICSQHSGKINSKWECLRMRRLHECNRAYPSHSHTGVLAREVEREDNLIKEFITSTNDDIFRHILEMITNKTNWNAKESL